MNYAKDQTNDPAHVSVNTLFQSKKQNRDRLPPYTQFEKEREKKGGTSETKVKGQESGKENSVVQKINDGPIPVTGKIVNTIGGVAPEANLRPAPTTTNHPVKLLQLNTRVQIVKEIDGGWYSISTEDGDTGYVAAHLIKKNPPEPSSRLHKVENGESAIGIAEKYYKSNAAQWGQDLRYYVNVLVYVNKGVGDPSKGIYTASAKDGWKETQVKSGYYIWIPGVEYAKSLQGVVNSGSVTYGMKEGIDNTIGFSQQKLDDFNYANQFVGKLLPAKLSDSALEAIKSALINFSLGMIAAGLLLAIAAGLGALIGALVGFFAGGAGAVPGAALGAKIGFEIGLFLLKWIGLGLLITSGASLLGKIGVAFGKYVINVWEASGNRKKLENSADLCAEAMKEFLLGVLELVVMLVAAWGVGRAMGALAKTKFGEKIGYEKLTEWVNNRGKYETTIKSISKGSKYYTKTGEPIWPPNDGFAGKPTSKILSEDTLIDRYGYENGTYASPAGTPFEKRALPASYRDTKPLKKYLVKKPVEVQAGEIEPWFDQPGRGIQYKFNKTIQELLDAEILKEVVKN